MAVPPPPPPHRKAQECSGTRLLLESLSQLTYKKYGLKYLFSQQYVSKLLVNINVKTDDITSGTSEKVLHRLLPTGFLFSWCCNNIIDLPVLLPFTCTLQLHQKLLSYPLTKVWTRLAPWPWTVKLLLGLHHLGSPGKRFLMAEMLPFHLMLVDKIKDCSDVLQKIALEVLLPKMSFLQLIVSTWIQLGIAFSSDQGHFSLHPMQSICESNNRVRPKYWFLYMQYELQCTRQLLN